MRYIVLLLLVVNIFIPVAASAQDASTITVEADSDAYYPGDKALVSGTISKELLREDERVVIQVFTKQYGTLVRIDSVLPNSTGSYVYEFPVGGTMRMIGEYRIVATYRGHQAEDTFVFDSIRPLTCENAMGFSGGLPKIYQLSANNQSYPIHYYGTVSNITANYDRHSLIVKVSPSSFNCLVINLPRSVIDARNGTADIGYTVFADGRQIDFREVSPSEEARILVIKLDQDTRIIEIMGTAVVPEFGSMIVLAIAVAGKSSALLLWVEGGV